VVQKQLIKILFVREPTTQKIVIWMSRKI